MDPPPSQRTFRFLDPPAELRNRNYTIFLVDSKPFWLTLQAIHRRGSLIQPEILRTCRRVHSEANAMLYASNTLEGYKKHIFATWLASIGGNVKHPTSLKVNHVQTVPSFYQRLPPLKITVSLQRFEFPRSHACWEAEDVAKMLAPMVRAIYRARKRKGDDYCAEDALQMLVMSKSYEK